MHNYDGFFGMHLIWWFIWIVFLIWVFMIPTQWGKKNKKRRTTGHPKKAICTWRNFEGTVRRTKEAIRIG